VAKLPKKKTIEKLRDGELLEASELHLVSCTLMLLTPGKKGTYEKATGEGQQYK
jgi:hypothetical protein